MSDGVCPEFDLVCASIAPTQDSDRRERIETLLDSPLEWALVVEIARHHGVLGLLHRGLVEPDGDAVDESMRRDLDAALRAQTLRNLSMARTLHDLLDRFEVDGIRAIPFKGPVLAAATHGSVAHRTFNDLDILVHKADFSAALDVLETMGYEGGPGAPRLDDAAILGGPFTPALATEYSFHHPDHGTTVEIRWRLGSDRFSFRPDFDALWERRASVTVAGHDVPALDPIDRLLYLSYHGVKHAFGLLKWVSDVAETVHALPRWAWGPVIDKAAALGVTRRVRIAVGVANRLLGVGAPEAILDPDDRRTARLIQRVVDRLQSDPLQPFDSIDTRSVHLGAGDTRRARLLASLAMYPIHPTLEDYRALPLPGPLHPALYLVRVVRLVVR